MDIIATTPTMFGIIPALLAIALAVLTRQVILSLFVGVLSGSVIFYFISAEDLGCFFGVDRVVDTYLVNAISDTGHVSVIIFSMFIAAMVSVLNEIGAFNGVVQWMISKVKSKKGALFSSYFLGFFVFFDDYANTLIVGNTMRNLTDKYKISREKLAFIVDATAAPIASIALVSTWIGFEVNLINDGISETQLNTSFSGYGIFMEAIKYSFYPILILIFIFILIWRGKDFGLMYKFEVKAQSNQADIKRNVQLKSINGVFAVIPIVVMVIVTFVGIFITGYMDGFTFVEAFQNGDCYKGLLWGSSTGLILSVLIGLGYKFKLRELIEIVVKGFKSLIEAITVLILAWALNNVLEDLQLGEFIANAFVDFGVTIYAIPPLVFILSGIIAFSTGSSFSTMGIMVPLIIQLFAGLGYADSSVQILAASIASVLSGSVLGDHCSPISDTTILSSMATGCKHINHVNTQLTYCLIVGGVALVLLLLQTVTGLNWIWLFAIGIGVIYLIIRYFGKPTNIFKQNNNSLTKK